MTSALPDHVTSADATQSTSAGAGGKVHLAQILQRTKDHMSIQHKVGWYYMPDNSRFTSLAILGHYLFKRQASYLYRDEFSFLISFCAFINECTICIYILIASVITSPHYQLYLIFY